MVLIDAVYIHESGGKTLLDYFIRGVLARKCKFILFLDKRITAEFVSLLPGTNVIFVNATERDRYLMYKKYKEQITSIFCFANVPPPIFMRKKSVFILFHNSLILSNLLENNSHSLFNKLFFLIRRFYIRLLTFENYKWIVQTNVMKEKLNRFLKIPVSSIYISPFFSKEFFSGLSNSTKSIPKFLYVADGVPQKNHFKLLEAWRILFFKYDLSYELSLTVPERFVDVNIKINELIKEGVRIKNYGNCAKPLLRSLYLENNFLIFPSLSESFGLPLLEAAESRCKILASNLPYVYELINPSATFDPNSSDDIAKVVSLVSNSINIPETEIIIEDHRDQIINLLFNY